MSSTKVFWLRIAALLWTLSAVSILIVEGVSHNGSPLVTLLAWLAGISVYYAIAIKHRV